MAASAVIYARVPVELHEWVQVMAERNGLTKAMVVALLLKDAKSRGVDVTVKLS